VVVVGCMVECGRLVRCDGLVGCGESSWGEGGWLSGWQCCG